MTVLKSCFVIMPYGKKKGPGERKPFDFDAVYTELIRRALHSARACPGYRIRCKRSDGTDRTGWIHKKMIEDIHSADLAVVDLSMLNPNVFYELGVRHALVPSGTILIRRDGTRLPFNLAGFNTVTYPRRGGEASDDDKANFRAKLRRFASSSITVGGVDSLVHDALRIEVRTLSPPIGQTDFHEYRLVKRPDKRVGLVTGDIINVKGVDAWVNSENTKMQMDRHTGGSISSMIRYYGAIKDRADRVKQDIVFDELAEVVKQSGAVDPASVIDTTAGKLEARNGVRRIFHVASVIGQVGVGFRSIPDIGACVERVLERADSPELATYGIRSVLFPLMGTGTARGGLEEAARKLIGRAVDYFLNNSDSSLERVYFLNWTRDQLQVCRRILQLEKRVELVDRPARPAAGSKEKTAKKTGPRNRK